MNAGMKMLMISNARRGGSRGGSGGRNEMGYGGMETGNEMESRRRRDSRGRFRSEMGGMENEMDMRRGGGRSEMGYGNTEMRRGGSGGRSEMGYGESGIYRNWH